MGFFNSLAMEGINFVWFRYKKDNPAGLPLVFGGPRGIFIKLWLITPMV